MARISKGQLEKLQKRYRTDAAIGRLFRISRQAVHQLRIRYGIVPVEEKNAQRNREIVTLFSQGISGEKLAVKFRMSVSQIYRVIKRENLTSQKKT